jgi:hypothetical protein
MEKKIFFIVDDGHQNNRGRIYHEGIKIAPAGYKVTIEEAAKSRDQEAKYHAMIGDIAKTCEFMGRKWDRDDWKRLLVDAFVRVMRDHAKAQGNPDPFAEECRMVPTLDGSGFVQLGAQTRHFKKRMASEFIEFLFAYGAERGVIWSNTSKHYFEEMRA